DGEEEDTTLLLRKQRLLVALAFGFVGAILLPALAYRPHRPSADQASSDDEMYEVYSAAIKELYLNKFQGVKGGGADSGLGQLVLIRDRTTYMGHPVPTAFLPGGPVAFLLMMKPSKTSGATVAT